MHWGVGPAERAEVRVRWPDGEATGWQPVDADTFVLVNRGEPGVEVVTPGG
jgi:hypothetical protein